MFQVTDTLQGSLPPRAVNGNIDGLRLPRIAAPAGALKVLARAATRGSVFAFRKLAERVRARRRRRRSLRELSRLNDYQLADIGLDRTDLRRLAGGYPSARLVSNAGAPGTNLIAGVLAEAEAQTPAVARMRHTDPLGLRGWRV